MALPTYRDLCACCKSVGVPYARIQWDAQDGSSPPPLPYALLVPGTTQDAQGADANRNARTPYVLELYERGSGDMGLEARLEAALTEAGIPYQRYCVPLGGGVVEMAYHVAVSGR